MASRSKFLAQMNKTQDVARATKVSRDNLDENGSGN